MRKVFNRLKVPVFPGCQNLFHSGLYHLTMCRHVGISTFSFHEVRTFTVIPRMAFVFLNKIISFFLFVWLCLGQDSNLQNAAFTNSATRTM